MLHSYIGSGYTGSRESSKEREMPQVSSPYNQDLLIQQTKQMHLIQPNAGSSYTGTQPISSLEGTSSSFLNKD
jgi:hypothetical protein